MYLAAAYILSHRGHFLIDAPKDAIAEVISFDKVYADFNNYLVEGEIPSNWSFDIKMNLEISSKVKLG